MDRLRQPLYGMAIRRHPASEQSAEGPRRTSGCKLKHPLPRLDPTQRQLELGLSVLADEEPASAAPQINFAGRPSGSLDVLAQEPRQRLAGGQQIVLIGYND